MTEALLPDGITLYRLTKDRAVALWETLKGYDVLWPDDTRGDVVRWVEFAVAPTTQFLEEDGGNGMYILSEIKPGLKANVHAVLRDHRLHTRVQVVRSLLAWAMFEFDLYRLEARIPAFSHALRRWLQRDLGFTCEGVLRDAFWYKEKLISTVILSLLRDEIK